MQETGQTTTSSLAASSLPSSSEQSSCSALQIEVKDFREFHSSNDGTDESYLQLILECPESDEEIRRVPEMGGESAGTLASLPEAGGEGVKGTGEGQRKRGRSPADKESKRLKRLLRNRVSAQQARERKKAYLIDLEARVKDLEKKNSEMEEKLSTLQNENQMLRHILKNTTTSRRGGTGNVTEGTL